MSLFSILVAASLAAVTPGAPLVSASPAPLVADTGAGIKVTVDSAKHFVRVLAGPFDLANMPPMDDHGMMDHGMMHDTPFYRFAWPVEGWLYGFEWRLKSADGRVIPREVMHHMIMANLSRRQLLYSAAERLLGAGTETEDVKAPKTVGVPLQPGADLGFYIAWHNSTGQDLKGVYLEFDMLWTPKNQAPRPVDALPLYMDVNLTVGGSDTYDVPPGRSEKSWTFTMPINGHILGLGGHLHDYGSSVRFEDAETGKVIVDLPAKRDPQGKILGVGRKLFALNGNGYRVKAGHKYRVVGVYDNPTGEMQKNGAMAHVSGLISPDNLADWPQIDRNDSSFRADMASLNLTPDGQPLPRAAEADAAGHDGHAGHDMSQMDHGAAADSAAAHADHDDMSGHDMSGHDMGGGDMSGHDMAGHEHADSAGTDSSHTHTHTHTHKPAAPKSAAKKTTSAKSSTTPR